MGKVKQRNKSHLNLKKRKCLQATCRFKVSKFILPDKKHFSKRNHLIIHVYLNQSKTLKWEDLGKVKRSLNRTRTLYVFYGLAKNEKLKVRRFGAMWINLLSLFIEVIILCWPSITLMLCCWECLLFMGENHEKRSNQA